MLIDPKSYETAEHFLRDEAGATPERTQELAEAIQRVVEDFCSALIVNAVNKEGGA